MIRLAWRNLFQNSIQLTLGVGGVTLALLLMLAFDGILAGSENDLVAYIEKSGADVFVAQEGVKNMHMAASAISNRDLRVAARAEGVLSASPILYASSVVHTDRADVLSYVIGFDPREPLGGPSIMVAGRQKLGRGEAIIDEVVAQTQEVHLGDEIEVFGKEFTVVGITTDLTSIINTVTFIHLRDFQDLRGKDVLSYALLRVDPQSDPAEVAAAIMEQDGGVEALSRAEFSREERQIIKDMSTEILNIMNLSGFLIGLAVTALTLYTSTLNKRQEYGVLKAIGARNVDLYMVVIAQTILSLSFGFAVAVSIAGLLGAILPAIKPGAALALTSAGMARVLLVSLVIGILAALAPVWQIARLDPAQVFRK